MSQYSDRFNEMLNGGAKPQSKPSKPSAPSNNQKEYETPGSSRTLHFVWPDGERVFLYYFHGVKGKCSADETVLTLVFSNETAVLKGRNLGKLCELVSQQLIREIPVVDERYLELEEKEDWVVFDIKLAET